MQLITYLGVLRVFIHFKPHSWAPMPGHFVQLLMQHCLYYYSNNYNIVLASETF